MNIEAELINGFGFGVEYVDDDIFGKVVIVEVLFFRFLFQWGD